MRPLTASLYAFSAIFTTYVILSLLHLPRVSFFRTQHANLHEDPLLELCPQPPFLTPHQHYDVWVNISATYNSEAFVKRAIDWLAGAVKIPTESYNQMGPIGTDPRWKIFGSFHDYLAMAFPSVHATLNLTKVNTYGLLYEWKGSNVPLKPVLLAAHQDVVPVNPETIDDWVHPPYSGHFDGERIWGRGTSDDKNGLIGILSAVETLIENGFTPTRSLVLAFGFDEEATGFQGAAKLNDHLLDHYGEKSFAMLVDEGGDYMNEFGRPYATPGITEKGYLDVRVEVQSPGGHSSVPPAHTSIGILSALLVNLEENPFVPKLARGTPMYNKAFCLAAHAPDLPRELRAALRESIESDEALQKAEDILFKDEMFKALVGTTQAIDLISGGVKTNALPESAWAVVNHRIATDSSLDEVKERDTNTLKDIAAKFNLAYTAFGKNVTSYYDNVGTSGKLNLSVAWNGTLGPAPITPTDEDAGPFQLLAGTIRATHAEHRGGKDVVVSPGIMGGNSDTAFYWRLTDHIFRYNHLFSGDTGVINIHTINEYIKLDAYLEMIKFFALLILNADESTTI
ncbi:carboxypeptidase S [Panus rudis PR-1116 ss-1]|nr:carboxypeptidase S [Panus rudis PR-1116 ss-1]